MCQISSSLMLMMIMANSCRWMDENANTIYYYEKLSTMQLKKQLNEFLESISNDNDRIYHLKKLHSLILSAGARLDDNQLKQVLRTIGMKGSSYDTFNETTTTIELELHLRTYALTLEACGKRAIRIAREFHKKLYVQLVKLCDLYQQFAEKGSALGQVENYNIDFFLLHLHDTLHAMDNEKAHLFKILRPLKAAFTSLVSIFPSMDNIMANIQTPVDTNTSFETYSQIQKDLNQFSDNYWYKDWRYLYSTYQEFIEWSVISINKDFIDKGELMIVKDLWRFGNKEWTKATIKSEFEMGIFRSKLKHILNKDDYISVSFPYSLLYGVLEVAQNLVMSAKNASTLAHCYYLAKLSLDIVSTEYIQFKAMEVLLTIYKKEPYTFSVVQLDFSQHIETLVDL